MYLMEIQIPHVKEQFFGQKGRPIVKYCNSTSSSNFNLHLPLVFSERDGRSCQLLQQASAKPFLS